MPLVQVPPGCEGCGACCMDMIVDVEDGCAMREDFTEVVAGKRIMKRQGVDKHRMCVALDPLSMRCTEYENRPRVCRGFTRDTPDCVECVSRLSMSQLNAHEERVERVLKAAVAFAEQAGYHPTVHRDRDGKTEVYLQKAHVVSTVSDAEMQIHEDSLKRTMWDSL